MWLYNDVHSVFVKQSGKNTFRLASFFEGWGRVSEEDLVNWSRTVDLDFYSDEQIKDALLLVYGFATLEELERAFGSLCESDVHQRVAIALFKVNVQSSVHDAQKASVSQQG